MHIALFNVHVALFFTCTLNCILQSLELTLRFFTHCCMCVDSDVTIKVIWFELLITVFRLWGCIYVHTTELFSGLSTNWRWNAHLCLRCKWNSHFRNYYYYYYYCSCRVFVTWLVLYCVMLEFKNMNWREIKWEVKLWWSTLCPCVVQVCARQPALVWTRYPVDRSPYTRWDGWSLSLSWHLTS